MEKEFSEKRFLCKIGIHEWEEISKGSETQNLAGALLLLPLLMFCPRRKCTHCGKTK
jgi:hypothetical protein